MAARPVHANLTKGMERSFAGEVGKLTLGANQVFHGEAILAVTKAWLESAECPNFCIVGRGQSTYDGGGLFVNPTIIRQRPSPPLIRRRYRP